MFWNEIHLFVTETFLGLKLQRCIFILFHSRCKCLEHWLNPDVLIRVRIDLSIQVLSFTKLPVVYSASVQLKKKTHFYWHADTFGYRRSFIHPATLAFCNDTATVSQCKVLSRKKSLRTFNKMLKNSSFDVLFQSVVDSWYEHLKTLMGFVFFLLYVFFRE